ncbi:YtpI family protein [Paenibacillus sp. J2TS4]|uniref:YtpI family protein n=1 Tax=Paenibacillus sp. J2TS4 TaxID=2807194 RepID=UPI001B1A1F0A|nr:YtpI family protein [Paenibacillus sp. J2TS4]GIP33695.1 hypothetical protein J2TS4_29050 [Paenibacillus sp. J2TS4]
MSWYHYILFVLVLASLAASAFYSIRYRTRKDPQTKGFEAAKMNISMGVMLISIAFAQFILFDPSFLRGAVGAVFLLLGLFNAFAGFKNYSSYKKTL